MWACPSCGFQNTDGRAVCKSCRQDRQAALQQVEAAYQVALGALKANPASADLKQAALAAGRKYSSATRAHGAVTIYDEMALMNDINAATAAATPAAPASVEDRLRKLDELRTRGVITEREHQDRRLAILNEL